MRKRMLVSLLFALGALGLEITPWGAVLHFALDGGETVRKTYSYFSLVPYGYANFFPLLTAILTVLLVAYLIFALITQKPKAENSSFYLALVGTIFSLLPLLYGLRNFSAVGGGIALCLGLSAAFLFRKERLQ